MHKRKRKLTLVLVAGLGLSLAVIFTVQQQFRTDRSDVLSTDRARQAAFSGDGETAAARVASLERPFSVAGKVSDTSKPHDDRKIIRTASLTLRVEQPEKAVEQLDALAQNLGG